MGTEWSGEQHGNQGWQQQPAQAYYPPQGYGPIPQGQPDGPRTSALAIAALIVGIIGICLPALGGLIAIGLGIAGLVVISRSGGTRTGTPLAIIGIALGAVGILAWVLLLTSQSFWDGVRDGYQESQLASTLTPGDCLEISTEDTDQFEATTDDIVSCEGPHSAEFAGRRSLSYGSDAPYPDESILFEDAFDLCQQVFSEHVGLDLFDTDLDVFVTYPTSGAWRLFDDRDVACFVTSLDGSPLTAPVGSG